MADSFLGLNGFATGIDEAGERLGCIDGSELSADGIAASFGVL